MVRAIYEVCHWSLYLTKVPVTTLLSEPDGRSTTVNILLQPHSAHAPHSAYFTESFWYRAEENQARYMFRLQVIVNVALRNHLLSDSTKTRRY